MLVRPNNFRTKPGTEFIVGGRVVMDPAARVNTGSDQKVPKYDFGL
jgi:hypothetical protein